VARPFSTDSDPPPQRKKSGAINPDQRSKAAIASALAVGIEAGIGNGIESTTINGGNPVGCQAQTSKGVNVSHETAWVLARYKSCVGLRMRAYKSFANFPADFERRLTNCRAEPDQYLVGCSLQAIGS